MEHWSAADDRPAYLDDARSAPRSGGARKAPRPRKSPRFDDGYPPSRWTLPALLAVLGVVAAAFFGINRREDVSPPQVWSPAPAARESAARESPASVTSAPPAEAGPRYELKPRAEEALPTLEGSDPMIGQSISGLVGRHAFERFVIPGMIVRHVVATVDNLPRPTGSTRSVPLRRVPGTLALTAGGDDRRIDASNARRYTPYVRIFASIDAHALAERYAATYPLFQRAYEELGYPGGHFNDRLIAAIDDLLAAPELDAPAKVVQSPVVYKFADPDLEGRSAGQKIMMRMGKANALAVKTKLRQVRGEIVALAQH
jgi:DUF3014 family protein